MKYVALLRGINVGGKNPIKMVELRECLGAVGLGSVQTYINSGNVLFDSEEQNREVLTNRFESAIHEAFGLTIPSVIISKQEFKSIAKKVPKDWLKSKEYKYNYIFLKAPYDMKKVIGDVGEIKPDIEAIAAGDGVLYQAMSIQFYGRTTFSKIVGKPVYKTMTIRNHNTVTKILSLLEES